MKTKKYITPQTQELKIETAHVLMDSPFAPGYMPIPIVTP